MCLVHRPPPTYTRTHTGRSNADSAPLPHYPLPPPPPHTHMPQPPPRGIHPITPTLPAPSAPRPQPSPPLTNVLRPSRPVVVVGLVRRPAPPLARRATLGRHDIARHLGRAACPAPPPLPKQFLGQARHAGVRIGVRARARGPPGIVWALPRGADGPRGCLILPGVVSKVDLGISVGAILPPGLDLAGLLLARLPSVRQAVVAKLQLGGAYSREQWKERAGLWKEASPLNSQ